MVALGMDPAGTLAFAAAWTEVGLVMTAVTAVAAQVATTTRGCSAIALGILSAAVLIRAVADSVDGAGWLSWLSPLGWMTKIQPYGANRFSVLLLALAAAATLTALALALLERRDLGSGLVATRPGPARAGRWLGSSLGLAWRLQYWSLLGWTLAIALGGALIGSLAGSLESTLEDSSIQELLRGLGGDGPTTLVDLFLSAEFSIVGLAVAGYGISATLRLRGEERAVHADPVLATPTTRWSFLAGHLLIALFGTTWLLLVLGTAVGLVRGLATGDLAGELARLVPAATAPLPGVWVCVGLTVLLFGLVPRWTSTAWIVLILFLVVGELGSLLGLPEWVRDLSPFAHLPSLPGGALTVAPLLALAAATTVLATTGSVGFRRRDVG
jgi:ABC-2 type transport system permease protein